MVANNKEGEEPTTWTVADIKDLTIHGEQIGGAVVIKTAGRVDGSNASQLQGALENILDGNDSGMVLDLGDLSYISSAGLRVILLVAKRLQGKSAKFGVCSLPGPISEVFQISGFDKIIPTYAAQADALSDFSK